MLRRFTSLKKNPFDKLIQNLSKNLHFYNLKSLNDSRLESLPISIRLILESAVRNCDESSVTSSDIETILSWKTSSLKGSEVPFKPSRVVLQDLTGVPALIDLASMREVLHKNSKRVSLINPGIPVDLIINNEGLNDFSFSQNLERYKFLKWGQKAFNNFNIIPPVEAGSNILHEYLARIAFNKEGLLYPDSVLTTDKNSTLVNGLGVLGLGGGGIEAEVTLLNQPILMAIPKVVGFKFVGEMSDYATAADIVNAVALELKKKGLSGHFVEFFGDGCKQLRVSHRVTIANLAKEYGAILGYFPTDDVTLKYLRQTGKSDEELEIIEKFLKAAKFFRDYQENDPEYSEVIQLDLSTVKTAVSGPKRVQDKVNLDMVKNSFQNALTHQIGFQGFGLSVTDRKGKFIWNQQEFQLENGSIVLASINHNDCVSAIDSIVAAGLLAKKAASFGLKINPFIETHFLDENQSNLEFIKNTGTIENLEKIGFFHVKFDENSRKGLNEAIFNNDLIVSSVSSEESNYLKQANPFTKANYLASAPLVVAYALAGRINIDFTSDPIGFSQGSPVYLKDIWPSRDEVYKQLNISFKSQIFKKIREEKKSTWEKIDHQSSELFQWDPKSTYIKPAPFFKDFSFSVQKSRPIKNAFCLMNLGHDVTRDLISPEGKISRASQAGKYLQELGVRNDELNTFASRRGNSDVMVRGTYSSTRILNKFCPKSGPATIHFPTGREMSVFEASELYRKKGQDLIVLAGKNYGSGPSIGWASKGPCLLGVRAVIAESFNFMHSSNLIAMGVLPLEYKKNQNSEMLGLTGRERFSIDLSLLDTEKYSGISQHCPDFEEKNSIEVTTDTGIEFKVVPRMDSVFELDYFRNQGMLNYVLRKFKDQ
jgi:aconitate hydratase